MKLRGIAWAMASILVLAPVASRAGLLRVRPDPTNRLTGYFLLPQRSLDGLMANPSRLHQKISNERTFGPHPVSDTPMLSVGTTYYVYPECRGQLQLSAGRRISANEETVQLPCQ